MISSLSGTESPVGSHASPSRTSSGGSGIVPAAVVLALVWIILVVTVDPRGEFMVNDDWSFVKLLEGLSEGRMIATGWGHGGPSAIVHVLWGGLFTKIVGFSLTNLRISVLVLGVAGSFILLFMLRMAGASAGLALLASLTVVLNPLFLSQSFTFMTDITFMTLVLCSVFFLSQGMEERRTSLIVLGLAFALGGILTRQIGVVAPAGLVVGCLVHPRGRDFGRLKVLLLVVAVVILPWIAYEFFLFKVGSTPVTQHDVVTNIYRVPLEKGFLGFLEYLFSMILLAQIGYLGFFLAPLLSVRWRDYFKHEAFKYYFCIVTACFLGLEAALVSGLIDPPVLFHRNVIFDLGIGPILLKDIYILGIRRFEAIPKSLYFLLAYWAVLGAGVLLGFLFLSLKRAAHSILARKTYEGQFLGVFCLASALFYLGIITLTGFHDRYLIPPLVFLVLWLTSEHFSGPRYRSNLRDILPGVAALTLTGAVSVAGVHDFMAMKRGLGEAHRYLTHELKVDPCNIDGGFEFNGYHCYRKEYTSPDGLSWWWVQREDYLVALGPLDGYRTVKTFPFNRMLGRDGAIYVLKPEP
jgi:4-amino-4-deoxy-L-arabinose transferase-like glycosyltransferase